jgi:hypothetical protein
MQRVGRIARLGSMHSEALVHWFLPPSALDRRLGLVDHLERKARCQLQLGVTATSTVGRASVINELLASRTGGEPQAPRGLTDPVRGFAVVRAPPVACAVIVWNDALPPIRHLIVVAGTPPRALTDHRSVAHALETLDGAVPSPAAPPGALVAAIQNALRQRVVVANSGAVTADARALARIVLRHARRAAQRRQLDLLQGLDAVLDRLSRGVAEGAARGLAGALHESPIGIGRWLRDYPVRYQRPATCVVEAVLFGDGGSPAYRP